MTLHTCSNNKLQLSRLNPTQFLTAFSATDFLNIYNKGGNLKKAYSQTEGVYYFSSPLAQILLHEGKKP